MQQESHRTGEVDQSCNGLAQEEGKERMKGGNRAEKKFESRALFELLLVHFLDFHNFKLELINPGVIFRV